MYQLINGKEVAEKIKLQVKEEIKSLGKDVTLAVVIVGDNPASKVYVNNKKKACKSAFFFTRHNPLTSKIERG